MFANLDQSVPLRYHNQQQPPVLRVWEEILLKFQVRVGGC